MPHTCHAKGCTREIPPRLLMCKRHWLKVPKELQARIWATYIPKQEITKSPTMEYLRAAQDAIDTVANKEGR